MSDTPRPQLAMNAAVTTMLSVNGTWVVEGVTVMRMVRRMAASSEKARYS
jgi:hypothetical protein